MYTLGKALGLSLPSVESGGKCGIVAPATVPLKHHRNYKSHLELQRKVD